MIRAGIIGISGFGSQHYSDLLAEVEAGNMRAAAATVINQEEEAEKCARLRGLGCSLFTDYREMLGQFAGQLDLCLIPTGIHLHAPMTIAALQAGANVFVEKPAAATVQEVAAMQRAAAAAGRFVAVGYQTMYAGETIPMKQALCSGRLGAVRVVKYWARWPRLDSYYQRNSWAGRLRANGAWILDSPFNNALAHQLNMIAFLAGSEPAESARLRTIEAELYRGHDIESADTACLRIQTHGGPLLYACLTHCSDAVDGPEVVAACERGTLRWTPEQCRIEHEDGTIEDVQCDPSRSRIYRQLRARIADPGAFVCDLDIAGTQTLAANGAHESSAIHPVDPRLILRQPENDSVKTVIRGIDELVLRAFAEEKMFSELGAAWARPGEVFGLDGYREFRGGRCGV